MPRLLSLSRPAQAGRALLLAALAVELADELADGTKSAALPLIRHSLALSYPEAGLLVSLPLLLGGLLELPVGVAAGRGAGRRRAILCGGLAVVASLAAVAVAGSFGWLLAAFVLFFPASGAFVSLTQAALMDADPARRAQHMARWTLAGSAGAVAGPLLLTVVLAAGGGWRTAYLTLAAVAAAAWLAVAGVARSWPGPAAPGDAAVPGPGDAALAGPGDAAQAGPAATPANRGEAATAGRGRPGVLARAREALGVARHGGALHWLALLQVSDLLLDVLTGFTALYLVDVAGATPAQAALGVAVRLGAGLAGDAAVVHFLERTADLRLLRLGAAAAALLYPGFLLIPGLPGKLVLLALLSFATASWYPVLQARWYQSLPGHSDVAVSFESAAAIAGGLGPAAVGTLAGWAGLAPAMAVLTAVPILIFALTRRPRPPAAPQPPPPSGLPSPPPSALPPSPPSVLPPSPPSGLPPSPPSGRDGRPPAGPPGRPALPDVVREWRDKPGHEAPSMGCQPYNVGRAGQPRLLLNGCGGTRRSCCRCRAASARRPPRRRAGKHRWSR